MPILVTSHASNILTIVQIICIIHLLYWLNPLSQETTHSAMLSLALLAKAAPTHRTLTNHMSPLVALIADCSLRALLTWMSG